MALVSAINSLTIEAGIDVSVDYKRIIEVVYARLTALLLP